MGVVVILTPALIVDKNIGVKRLRTACYAMPFKVEGFVEPLEGFVEPLEGFVEPLENRRFSDQASAAKQNLDSTPRISFALLRSAWKSGVE